MVTFEIRDKFELASPHTSLEAVYQTIIEVLGKSYNSGSISAGEDGGLVLKGDLTGSFERALTKATARVWIENNTLHYCAEGTVSLGVWPWIWLGVGLFTGVALGIYLYMLISYLSSKRKPKACFEDAFKAILYKYS